MCEHACIFLCGSVCSVRGNGKEGGVVYDRNLHSSDSNTSMHRGVDKKGQGTSSRSRGMGGL